MAVQKPPLRIVELNFEATVELPVIDLEDTQTDMPALPETRQPAPQRAEAQLLSINSPHAAALQRARGQGSQLHDELAAARQQAAAQIAALDQSLRDVGQAQQASAAELRAAVDFINELSAALAASQSPDTQQQDAVLPSSQVHVAHDGDAVTVGKTGFRYQHRS